MSRYLTLAAGIVLGVLTAGCRDGKSASEKGDASVSALAPEKAADAALLPAPIDAPEKSGPAGMEEVDLSGRGQPVKVYLPVGATIKKADNTFRPALNVTAPNGFSLRIGPSDQSSMAVLKRALIKEAGAKVTVAEQGDLGWLLRHHAGGVYTAELFRKDARHYCLAEAKRDEDLEPMIAACRTLRPAKTKVPAKIFSDESP